MKKKAMMGIGTLIIFIAAVLVASVSAGTILRTAGVLRQKAYESGQAARTRVTNIFQLDSMFAIQENETVQKLIAYSQLQLSSDSVMLKKTYLRIMPDNIVYIPDYDNNYTFYNNYTKIKQICKTPKRLMLDLDDDYKTDKIQIVDGKVVLEMSTNFTLSDGSGEIYANNSIVGNYSMEGTITGAECDNINLSITPYKKIGHYTYELFGAKNNNSMMLTSIDSNEQVKFTLATPPYHEDDEIYFQIISSNGFITSYDILFPQLIKKYVQVS